MAGRFDRSFFSPTLSVTATVHKYRASTNGSALLLVPVTKDVPIAHSVPTTSSMAMAVSRDRGCSPRLSRLEAVAQSQAKL